MKKIKAILIMLILILGMTSCNSEKAITDKLTLEIAEDMMKTQIDIPNMDKLESKDEGFSAYISERYMIDANSCEEATIFYATGARAEELAVVLLKDDADVAGVEELLREYIKKRAGDFNGYAPDQVELLSYAQVVSHGKHIALMICYDIDSAKAAFDIAFNDNVKSDIFIDNTTSIEKPELNDKGYIEFKQPNKEDLTIYDTTAIIKAYKNKEGIATLSDKDKKILEICQMTIDSIITKNMSDYEKELAVHDWIIEWTSYDEDVFSKSSSQASDTKSDNINPYGLLVNRKSICLGYTTTFQLFMDLLDIECITVIGAAWNSTEDHAWNMVKIDGDWYAVDVTWDDPIGINTNIDKSQLKAITHNYFNVTSQYMRDSDHQWDYENIPEATK